MAPAQVLEVNVMLRRLMVVSLLVLVAGCAPAPRTRAVKGGPVDTGAGTLTAARKFLEGRWTLESFQLFPPGGQPMTLAGSGTLVYDDFSNLDIDIRPEPESVEALSKMGIELQGGIVSTHGRAVLDLQNKTLTYVLKDPIQGARNSPLSTGRPRHWNVDGDLLTLSTRDDAGNTLTEGKWRRQP
jgi:hypothetical protein